MWQSVAKCGKCGKCGGSGKKPYFIDVSYTHKSQIFCFFRKKTLETIKKFLVKNKGNEERVFNANAKMNLTTSDKQILELYIILMRGSIFNNNNI
jgi:hypothetical protein